MPAHQAIARIEPTQAQLRDAFARIRNDTWPASFEAAMADKVCAALVRMNALHPPAPLRHVSNGRAPAPAPAPAANRPPPAPRVVTPVAPPPGWVDHKRAAAGDRDDD